MAKDLPEEVKDEAVSLGKEIAKDVIKSVEYLAGGDPKEDGESSVLATIRKILPKNPFE